MAARTTRSTLPQDWSPQPGGGFSLDTESGHAFYQERFGLFAKLLFVVVGGFYILGNLLAAERLEGHWALVGHVSFGGVLLVLGATWLVCRRARLSPASLHALDTTVTFLVGLLLPISAFVEGLGQELRYVALASVSDLLILRSIFVPSSPRHTVLVGVVASVPAALVAQRLYAGTTEALWVVAFLVGGIAVATVISHVFYGLRKEIRAAQRLGQRLGQYTLEEKLGEGGMGVVYRARHAMLRRPTAVKLLPAEKAGVDSITRFEREVQLTALLSHPNTVVIFDHGRTADGIFYYAMEYLEGITLESLVREHGPQPPGRVLHILTQVAGALGEAHALDLIHRDIKPANIILCERGGAPDVAKVLDFGLVKDLEEAEVLSRDHTICGTPQYLAPEAIVSPVADARTDLYGLGAVGYYLLTGHNVFEGRTVVEICGHHLHTTPVPPSQRLGSALPEKLEKIVLCCLEKDPARRPQGARALVRALETCDDVPLWTEERARDWWATHGEGIRRPASESLDGALAPPATEATLSVNLGDRLAGHSGSGPEQVPANRRHGQ